MGVAFVTVYDKGVTLYSITEGKIDDAIRVNRNGKIVDFELYEYTHFSEKEYKITNEKGTPINRWGLLDENNKLIVTIIDMKESWLLGVIYNGKEYTLREVIKSVGWSMIVTILVVLIIYSIIKVIDNVFGISIVVDVI